MIDYGEAVVMNIDSLPRKGILVKTDINGMFDEADTNILAEKIGANLTFPYDPTENSEGDIQEVRSYLFTNTRHAAHFMLGLYSNNKTVSAVKVSIEDGLFTRTAMSEMEKILLEKAKHIISAKRSIGA